MYCLCCTKLSGKYALRMLTQLVIINEENYNFVHKALIALQIGWPAQIWVCSRMNCMCVHRIISVWRCWRFFRFLFVSGWHKYTFGLARLQHKIICMLAFFLSELCFLQLPVTWEESNRETILGNSSWTLCFVPSITTLNSLICSLLNLHVVVAAVLLGSVNCCISAQVRGEAPTVHCRLVFYFSPLVPLPFWNKNALVGI